MYNDSTSPAFRSGSLCKKAYRVCCEHYKPLRSEIHQLPVELRSMINLHHFNESLFPIDQLLPKVDQSVLCRIKTKENASGELYFHYSDEYGDWYDDDRCQFTTMMDPEDRKRLIILTRVNNSKSYSIEYCPTLPRYYCSWHNCKRCYRRLPHVSTPFPLSRFITQNPYIDYILSFSNGIVQHSESFPTLGLGVSAQPEKIARIHYSLSWLHLISTSPRRLNNLDTSFRKLDENVPIIYFAY